ncbi:hypothetical protein E3N88_09052 [Mikania micrantha]|uniref:CCHC-type domain-containing protein n=1 Tax=Mikania micrantha TaxID=192012 RepID=A0A5N6PK97_9ASTR|nr:hypothetical protein E3N88_09052 [Mikania micrantha]
MEDTKWCFWFGQIWVQKDFIANVAKGKGYSKGKGKGKAKGEPPKPKEKKQKVAANDPCFKCGEIGHWMRNCPVYLKELKEKRDAGQTSGVQKN